MRVFERGGERVEIDVIERTVVIRRARDGGVVDETSREASSAPKAKWDADRAAADCVAQGFVRIGGDPVAPSQDELMARLEANPGDLDTYLVLADWLSERGDPWGLVMAVQTAIAQLPRFTPEARRDELAREDALLLFQHAARLWGELGDTIVNTNTQTYAIDLLRPEWHCGFVRAIATDVDGITYLPAFASLDLTRLLQSISIEADEWAALADGVFEPLLDVRWPQLRQLAIHCAVRDRPRRRQAPPGAAEIDCAEIASILDGTRAPRLIKLTLSFSRNTDVLCHALATSPLAPRMRSLALHSSQLTDAGIAALARAPLDTLEELVITGNGPADAAARLRDKARHVRIALGAANDDDDDL